VLPCDRGDRHRTQRLEPRLRSQEPVCPHRTSQLPTNLDGGRLRGGVRHEHSVSCDITEEPLLCFTSAMFAWRPPEPLPRELRLTLRMIDVVRGVELSFCTRAGVLGVLGGCVGKGGGCDWWVSTPHRTWTAWRCPPSSRRVGTPAIPAPPHSPSTPFAIWSCGLFESKGLSTSRVSPQVHSLRLSRSMAYLHLEAVLQREGDDVLAKVRELGARQDPAQHRHVEDVEAHGRHQRLGGGRAHRASTHGLGEHLGRGKGLFEGHVCSGQLDVELETIGIEFFPDSNKIKNMDWRSPLFLILFESGKFESGRVKREPPESLITTQRSTP
jgi:hypothetical protein